MSLLRNFVKRVFEPYTGFDALASNLQTSEECEVVAVCIIIRDFESIAGRSTLRELGQLINQYYSIVADSVLASDGDISEFCGPKIFARYGAIRKVPIARVIAAGGALRRELTRLESESQVRIGLGLCRGPVLLGRFGSVSRAAFSALGPPVICSEQIATSGNVFGLCQSLADQFPEARSLYTKSSLHPHWSPGGQG